MSLIQFHFVYVTRLTIKKRLFIPVSIKIGTMVLVLIGIAIGILIVAILIIKTTKTPSRDIFGVDLHCVTCGTKTNGSKCPKCEKSAKTFGV